MCIKGEKNTAFIQGGFEKLVKIQFVDTEHLVQRSHAGAQQFQLQNYHDLVCEN